jgi:hypothetical protein
VIERGLVRVHASALKQHRTVPLEAELIKRVKDMIRGPGLDTRCIEVFHAHQPSPVLRACIDVARGGGYERAEVKRASWRRCEPADVSGGQS